MNDLDKIKKYYGEKMMHLCRNLFPTLLEKENTLFDLLESNFAPSKYLYDDIINAKLEVEFKNYIYSLVDIKQKEIEVKKSPKELLEEAGYILYECKTESDIQYFKKYYKFGEELCTFNGGRLKSCYVFFAIKKNVDKINRQDFPNPKRQDEYGTSVISIQFTKGKINTLSIKNRYNHSVINPDATFSNNLENIITGLTKSFEKEYNLNINQNNNKVFDLPGYVMDEEGKYYKYNYEIDNIYYCPNNVIIDKFQVKKEYLEKEKYLIIDYFILDLVNKKISIYDPILNDSFIDGLKAINKIEIKKIEQNKIIKINISNNNNVYIEIDKYNRIISYTNEFITDIEDNFLYYNEILETINIQNIETIGCNFLCHNQNLKEINMFKLITIGDNFLYYNERLEKLNILNIKYIGNSFLCKNKILKELNMLNLISIGNSFLYYNEELEKINIQNIQNIGNNFLGNNVKLRQIDMPKLSIIGRCFIPKNKVLRKVNVPNLKSVGDNFLSCNNNKSLKKILTKHRRMW